MSLPFYAITCSNCSFKDSYSHGVKYEYVGPESRKPVVGVGLCHSCDSVVDALGPFNDEHEKFMIEDQELWIARNKGLFAKFSKEKKSEISKAKGEISQIKARSQHFRDYEFEVKCLQCGGGAVALFPLPYGDYGVKEVLEVKHGCGGVLMVSIEGRLSFSSLKRVTFNEHGDVLSDESGQAK